MAIYNQGDAGNNPGNRAWASVTSVFAQTAMELPKKRAHAQQDVKMGRRSGVEVLQEEVSRSSAAARGRRYLAQLALLRLVTAGHGGPGRLRAACLRMLRSHR